MVKLPARPTILAASLAGILTALPVQAADTTGNPPAEVTESSNIEALTVTGKRSADQKGADDVFYKNVSSVYAGREYLERYRTDAAGDVFKGLNGVYNMNTRNAGSAITPNIRGISGKGRIPVTIDGTEQTVDVWMNNYGIADRNYVDPALFRSITVEKGPAMTRGVKSGVGGAVSIRTIEPADIIPEGKSWGVEVKTEFSNNTAEPLQNLNDYLGKDYRTLPGNPTADGASGTVDGANYIGLYQHLKTGEMPRRTRFANFKDDRNLLFSAAFKTSLSDGLIAYSNRRKGTYFSGNHGFKGYLNNPEPNSEIGGQASPTEALYPNMARFYRPKEEVPNSNVSSRTLLLKNNWYLPHKQQINLHYMDTQIRFGEMNPFLATILMGYANEYNMQPGQQYLIRPVQGLDSNIRSRTYKFGYQWKPESSHWIDLNADIWRVRTDSIRHQSGGPDLAVAENDLNYDVWAYCFRHHIPFPVDPSMGVPTCQDLINQGWNSNNPPNDPPNHPNGYKVFGGAIQRTTATRSGFSLSNRMRLSNILSLTLSARHQSEKLDEHSMMADDDQDIFGIMRSITGLTKLTGPRAGRRKEWGGQLSFDWRPTERLKIEGGIRYDRFWAFDDVLARARARRDPDYSIRRSEEMNAGGKVVTGMALPYLQIMTPQEIAAYHRARAEIDADPGNFETIHRNFEQRYGFFPDESLSRHDQNGNTGYVDGNGQYRAFDESRTVLYRPMRPKIVEYGNRKFHGPAFENGMFDQRVSNPQGKQGSYYRYLRANGSFSYHPVRYNDNYFFDYDYEASKYIEGANSESDTYDYRKYKDTFASINNEQEATYIYTPIADKDNFPPVKRLNGSAWSPMIALSYDLTDNGRLHLRWAQMTRFPSIYEATNISLGAVFRYVMMPSFDLRPERSTTWEAGYTYNFAPLWNKLREGDIRLTYFSNTIKNVIDTDVNKDVVQYDRKITRGIELQSRLDLGRFFMSIGGTYRLKQQTCDNNLSFAYDMYQNRVPACIEGGIGATRFYQSIQPKYSVNLDMGMRLLGEKLELGIRGIHHSRRSSNQHDELIQRGMIHLLNSTGRAYHWRASTIWDTYVRYRIGNKLSLNLGVNNLTNRYYLDPMSNVPTPGPGRTVTLGIKAKF